ncbi:nuclear transport factor 2 isoform X1 [Rana temporaria]|uniref:nuclear transport factor 2 isoform X1 n=1 Tax=Rana temporaria TaxID=8407 RepID=UPI001AAD958C|nr:nuclear transport factor 2 isoform X1 [Rana temporaria]XP_040184682.1 nuclear transport factor 2 isoform X1 [Rana temporaria]XP_040184683.1 nuclear transport factor 2 isoform X1 [Rana temporaria]
MDDKRLWEHIGCSFVQHYYRLFDSDRTQLKSIYTDASCLTWEGQQYQGKEAIIEKLSMLPFQKIQHSITSQDHQPTPDNCIISMVVGQLKESFRTALERWSSSLDRNHITWKPSYRQMMTPLLDFIRCFY